MNSTVTIMYGSVIGTNKLYNIKFKVILVFK